MKYALLRCGEQSVHNARWAMRSSHTSTVCGAALALDPEQSVAHAS